VPVIEAEEVSLEMNLDGEVVLVGEPFSIDIEVAFDDLDSKLGYFIEIYTGEIEPDIQVIASASLVGNHVGTFELSAPEAGEFSIQARLRNLQRDGSPRDGEPVTFTERVTVFAIDEINASVSLANPPEFWLVGEPFTSEVVLSDELMGLPVEVILRETVGGTARVFERFTAADERQDHATFPEEKPASLSISVLSGPRVLAVSDAYEFDVLSPEAMIQKFHYEDFNIARNGDAQALFEWFEKTTFPGIFNPTPDQVEGLIADFEDGRYTAMSYYFETIRDNTSNFHPEVPERFECFSIPDDWPPVPGRHFIFDYDRPFYIGDSWSPAGTDRGSRHLTFYDGNFYRWSYVC